MRLIDVHSGKVNVRVLDKDFNLGEKGYLKIPPGSAAHMENRWYIDAVLRMTVVDLDTDLREGY